MRPLPTDPAERSRTSYTVFLRMHDSSAIRALPARTPSAWPWVLSAAGTKREFIFLLTAHLLCTHDTLLSSQLTRQTQRTPLHARLLLCLLSLVLGFVCGSDKARVHLPAVCATALHARHTLELATHTIDAAHASSRETPAAARATFDWASTAPPFVESPRSRAIVLVSFRALVHYLGRPRCWRYLVVVCGPSFAPATYFKVLLIKINGRVKKKKKTQGF